MLANRIDLFTMVHKGIRWWLGRVNALLGATDFSSPESALALDALGELLAGLDEHARHEDTFIAPVLRRHAPERAAAWVAEHRAFERPECDLRDQLANFRELGPSHSSACATGLALYRALNRLTAEMLHHLDREEVELMPILWETCTDAELAAIMTSFKAVCGRDAAAFYQRNAPAYTQPERDILGV